MDDHPRIPPDPPAGLHDRIVDALARLPAAWRVIALRAQGRDWVVDLGDEGGQIGCQIVLLGERTAEETHGAWPRGSE